MAFFRARAPLIGEFIPGLRLSPLPLAGVFGMRPRRFLRYDFAGVLAWPSAGEGFATSRLQKAASEPGAARIPRGRRRPATSAAHWVLNAA
jgi:hypothetical protein